MHITATNRNNIILARKIVCCVTGFALALSLIPTIFLILTLYCNVVIKNKELNQIILILSYLHRFFYFLIRHFTNLLCGIFTIKDIESENFVKTTILIGYLIVSIIVALFLLRYVFSIKSTRRYLMQNIYSIILIPYLGIVCAALFLCNNYPSFHSVHSTRANRIRVSIMNVISFLIITFLIALEIGLYFASKNDYLIVITEDIFSNIYLIIFFGALFLIIPSLEISIRNIYPSFSSILNIPNGKYYLLIIGLFIIIVYLAIVILFTLTINSKKRYLWLCTISLIFSIVCPLLLLNTIVYMLEFFEESEEPLVHKVHDHDHAEYLQKNKDKVPNATIETAQHIHDENNFFSDLNTADDANYQPADQIEHANDYSNMENAVAGVVEPQVQPIMQDEPIVNYPMANIEQEPEQPESLDEQINDEQYELPVNNEPIIKTRSNLRQPSEKKVKVVDPNQPKKKRKKRRKNKTATKTVKPVSPITRSKTPALTKRSVIVPLDNEEAAQLEAEEEDGIEQPLAPVLRKKAQLLNNEAEWTDGQLYNKTTHLVEEDLGRQHHKEYVKYNLATNKEYVNIYNLYHHNLISYDEFITRKDQIVEKIKKDLSEEK